MQVLLRVALLLCLSAGVARAICPLNPVHFRVGADATYCTHDDIQSAIDAVGTCPAVIDVTREHLYGAGGLCTHAQSGGCHLSVAGKSVTLQGWGDGVSCYSLTQSVCPECGPGTTLPLVTLDGASSGGPVVAVSGHSNVALRNLTLSHGATAYDGSGGGIAWSAYGSLTIENSAIANNYAGYGGGINLAASGGDATLTLNPNTTISANTAQFSGGGGRLEGNSALYALKPQTLIAFNSALGHDPVTDSASGGYGGGVEVIGPASAVIGSPGNGNLAAIYSNDAIAGGGISVNAGQDNGLDARLTLLATDPAHPVALEQNLAASRGGALYLKSYSSGGLDYSSAEAIACLKGFRLTANGAADGAAIYADYDSDYVGTKAGSIVEINRSDPNIGGKLACDPGASADLGEVACNADAGCNRIDGNLAEDENAQPTTGATILVDRESELYADRLAVQDNSGGAALREIGENIGGDIAQPGPDLRNCLFTGNTTDAELLGTSDNSRSPLVLESCTIAGNAIGAASAIAFSAGVDLLDDLIDQPGKATLGNAGTVTAQYVLASDISTLPGDATVQTVGDPLFVDAANGDYHLQLLSPAVDYAGGTGGSDFDGNPRDVDLAAKPNAFGPRDVGAYERQSQYACDDASDALFCSGFEAP